MEAASRPVFEPLTDLPVEAPIDGSVPVGPASSSSVDSANAGPRKGESDGSSDELIDPESLLGTSEPDLLLAALNEAASSGRHTSGTTAGSTAPAAPAASTSFDPDVEDLLGMSQLLAADDPAAPVPIQPPAAAAKSSTATDSHKSPAGFGIPPVAGATSGQAAKPAAAKPASSASGDYAAVTAKASGPVLASSATTATKISGA
ncbi:MAG TPA: hypothetical protein VH209_12000, partial [Steroidobacteraceae bacterium]|nr:hypothetical protein [Steroidobacteraceae bacterium]